MMSVEECIGQKIKDLRSQINGRKIIVFGAGTKTKQFIEIWDIRDSIIFFVDNDEKLWESKLYGKKIFSPKNIVSSEQMNVVILIISPYVDQIRQQLKELGVTSDVYNGIDLLYLNDELRNHINYHNKFMKYIHSIDKFDVINKEEKTKEKIGIIIIPAFYGTSCYYSIVMLLLLLKEGYDARLIVDDLKGIENYSVCDGLSNICCMLVNKVISYIKANIVNLQVQYISEGRSEYISSKELNQIDKCALVSTIWHKSVKTFQTRYRNDEKIKNDFSIILRQNYSKIKGFYEQNRDITVINVYTGLYNDFGLYKILSENNENLRLTSFDSEGSNSARGKVCFCNGVVGELTEIKDILKKYEINPRLFNDLIEEGKEEFEKQLLSDSNSNAKSYQLVNSDDFDKKIGVLIPLNVEWDAAAFISKSAFLSMKQWLIETIKFLIENTDEVIMIREHPVKVLLETSFNFVDYKGLIEKNFGKNERIIFVSASDKINTYKQIKNCKLVLPYTSTVGIEAVLLNKSIVLCTDVYYQEGIPGGYCCEKEIYFKKVKETLKKPIVYEDLHIKKMLLAFSLHSYMGEYTIFHECTMKWTKYSIDCIEKLKVVEHFINMIVNNQSFIYQNYIDSKKKKGVEK